jgi:hypothetical protein
MMRASIALSMCIVAASIGGCSRPSKPANVCGGVTVDLQTDVANCGACGHVCSTPAHAAATCVAATCARGPCEAGWFDLDGATTFGCEVSCAGNVCQQPSGETLTLSSPPVPEAGLVAGTFVSGTSYGAQAQSSATHTNTGALGDPTPPVDGRGTAQQGGQYTNVGGFTSVQR